jgi:DNA primase large subunit
MLTIKDYSKYPFLPSAIKSLKHIPDLQKPIIKIIETDFGKRSLEIAKARLSNALYKTNLPLTTSPISPNVEIASFFFARVLLSVQRNPNKNLIEKFVTYETNRFYENYSSEVFHKKQDIEKDIGIVSNRTRIPLVEYVPIATKLVQSSARWKLVNMCVHKGIVDISALSKNKFDTNNYEPAELFFREQIKYMLRSKLPLTTLDNESRAALDPFAAAIFGQFYESMDGASDYGDVTESNFPPCVQKIIDMIQRHENPTHIGRFTMVSFLNEIGMSEDKIAEIFKTVRDFDMSQTIYQIEHISGKQGTPAYKCPACDTLKTNGLCAGKDNALCSKVKHPLGYYQAKHKFAAKKK